MEPKIGIYRHYKGNDYEVIGLAQHAETLEEMVVYKALYGDNQLWVRSREKFLEDVVYEDVKQKRYSRVG